MATVGGLAMSSKQCPAAPFVDWAAAADACSRGDLSPRALLDSLAAAAAAAASQNYQQQQQSQQPLNINTQMASNNSPSHSVATSAASSPTGAASEAAARLQCLSQFLGSSGLLCDTYQQQQQQQDSPAYLAASTSSVGSQSLLKDDDDDDIDSRSDSFKIQVVDDEDNEDDDDDRDIEIDDNQDIALNLSLPDCFKQNRGNVLAASGSNLKSGGSSSGSSSSSGGSHSSASSSSSLTDNHINSAANLALTRKNLHGIAKHLELNRHYNHRHTAAKPKKNHHKRNHTNKQHLQASSNNNNHTASQYQSPLETLHRSIGNASPALFNTYQQALAASNALANPEQYLQHPSVARQNQLSASNSSDTLNAIHLSSLGDQLGISLASTLANINSLTLPTSNDIINTTTTNSNSTSLSQLNHNDNNSRNSNNKTNNTSINHNHNHHQHNYQADSDDLNRIRNFIEQFKARRGALGLTQKQAAQCFRRYTNDRYQFSDNFVGHFEGFQFRPQTAMTIADSLADWLEFAENETRLGRQLQFMPGKVKETRKRKYEVIRIRDSAKRILVDAFEKNKSPSTNELELLSRKTNIPSRNIEIFFKNRRTSRQYHQ